MAEPYGILVDLDYCVGCYACEVACKQENKVSIGKQWIKVISVGPEEVDGKLCMDFIPMLLEGCTLCEHRLRQDQMPRCVDNCPTEAMVFCRNSAELLAAIRSGKRFHVSKLKGEVPAFG